MNIENIFGTNAEGLVELKRRFPCITGADELAEMDIPPPSWVLPELLPVGLTVLGGPKKLGKSYMVMQFCRDIVNNGGRVFYFAGEDTHALHKQRQKHVGLPSSANYQYVAGRENLFAQPQDFFDAISELLSIQHFDAIFVDTMIRAVKPQGSTIYKQDEYAYYVNELDPWTKLAEKHQTAILMVTHSVKGASNIYSDPLDHIHGTTAITATADWVLVMQRALDGSGAKLYSDGKMGASETYQLTKTNGIYFEIADTEKEAVIKGKATQNKILEFVKNNPGVRQVDIVSALKLLETNVCRDMRKLLRDEYVTIDDKKRYYATP